MQQVANPKVRFEVMVKHSHITTVCQLHLRRVREATKTTGDSKA